MFLVGVRYRKNGLCCCVLIINLWYREVTGHVCINSEVLPRVRAKGGQRRDWCSIGQRIERRFGRRFYEDTLWPCFLVRSAIATEQT